MIVVKGDQVSVVFFNGTRAQRATWISHEVGTDTDEDKQHLESAEFPGPWTMWNDSEGEHQPAQRFFISPPATPASVKRALSYRKKYTKSTQEVTSSRSESSLWDQYYGSGVKSRRGQVVIPDGSWKMIDKIDAIRYRRKGKHEGLYEHKFARQVPLHEAIQGDAFYLDLGRDFVADERGFVVP